MGLAGGYVDQDCDRSCYAAPELLTVHQYWTSVLPNAGTRLYVLDDIECLVTDEWRRLAEQGFLLRAPAVTAPALLQACASPSGGWRKISEVLCAVSDAAPAAVPNEFRERFTRCASVSFNF